MPELSKKGSSKVYGWICSVWPSSVWESQHASTGNSVSWSLGQSSRSSFHHRSPEHQELQDLNRSARSFLCFHDNVFLSGLLCLGTKFTQIFCIFSSLRIIVCTVPTLTSNCAPIVSIDTRQFLSMKFFIWPINSGVLTSLLLPHLSSSPTDSLPSLNLLCYSKADAQFMQDAPKAVWSIPYICVVFFPSLKQNFIVYHTSKVSSHPDFIFEIHQLRQSRVYSNCCCSCSFEAEIIKIGQSSYKKYSNNIQNFQVTASILNACTKKVWKLLEQSSYLFDEFNFYLYLCLWNRPWKTWLQCVNIIKIHLSKTTFSNYHYHDISKILKLD